MKILLLRILKDITKEELQNRKYLETKAFTVMKPIETSNKEYNNWIIEAPAGDCRRLVRIKITKLFYEQVRAEFFIRVIRCTNCQEYSNPTKSQCEYRTKCSGNHHMSECAENTEKCINCICYNKNDNNHQEISLRCPIFQKVKKKKRL